MPTTKRIVVRGAPKAPNPGKEQTQKDLLAGLTPFDKREVELCLIHGLLAQKKMFERLSGQEYWDLSAGDTAHALAFVSKAVGQTLRDASFAAGGPDSRSDMAVAAEVERVFEKLTPEQLAQLRQWRKEALDPTDPSTRG